MFDPTRLSRLITLALASCAVTCAFAAVALADPDSSSAATAPARSTPSPRTTPTRPHWPPDRPRWRESSPTATRRWSARPSIETWRAKPRRPDAGQRFR